MYALVLRVLQALSAASLMAIASQGHAGDDPNAPLGSNLSGIVDFSDEFPFVNLMKAARDWIPGNTTGCFDCRQPGGNPACNAPNACPVTIARDADGYVTGLAANQVIRTVIHAGNTPGRLPAGRYTMRFDGAGTFQFFGASVVSSNPGEIVFDVASSTGNNIGFNLTAISGGNHPRNIRILPPGGVCSNDMRRACDAGNPCVGGGTCQLYTSAGVAEAQLFQPRFLANLAPYRMIRFMDWMETNNSQVRTLADYPTVNSAFWHRVPFQVMAELGNRLGSDIWINLPHRADNAFIDGIATALRDSFRTDRKIYLEYSNENWNGIFSQGREIGSDFCPSYPDLAANCQQDGAPGNGIACEIDPNTFSIPQPAGSACFQALVRAWGDRSVEIFDRFDTVFGGSARQRLVRVIAAQAANPDLGRQIMARNVTGQTFTVASRTDAYASAPYFGTEYCTPDNGFNPDSHPAIYASTTAFLDHLQTQGLARARGFMEGSRQMLTTQFPGSGIRHIAYEGGQHLAGVGGFTFNNTCNAIFDAANNDPRMETIYRTYWSDWRNHGDEFAHFVNVGRWGPFGRWGLLEFQDQDPATSPKYTAMLGHSAANPCHWAGCTQGGGGGNVAPTLAYTPTAGNLGTPGTGPAFPAGVAGVAQASITISASGAQGSGSTALSGCAISGTGAAAFATPVVSPAGGVFNLGTTTGSIALSCTRGANPATATLSCTETRSPGGVATVAWSLSCPAASNPEPPLFQSGFEDGENPPVCTPAQLLLDPSLEATAPNGQSNPNWGSTSSVFGTVYCAAGLCPNDGTNPVPRTGSFYAWFGGTASAETSTLTQTVTIPAGAPRHLNFFLRHARSTPPFDATLRVKVGTTTVRTFNESASNESDYVARSIDLSAFANGQAQQIRFEYDNPGASGVSSFYLDDLSLECAANGQ
jgi:hypothetical protein